MPFSPNHPARYWSLTAAGRVQCLLCPNRCVLSPGQTGLCKVRRAGKAGLEALTYGQPVGLAVDPVEKKPLFHFYPGSKTFSYATQGCNLRCLFCQNHHISQRVSTTPPTQRVSPEALVTAALQEEAQSIAHTYTEPTVFYEYAYDVAQAASHQGLKNIFVTNGTIEASPLRELAPYLDAANVDLKAFSDDTYRNYCGGRLQPVLDSIQTMVELGVWVEVTTLVIPDLNDSAEELASIASFLASLDPDIPWHVSRFHPDYRLLDRAPTGADVLAMAYETGRKAGLHHVYVGNLPATFGQDTVCPNCDMSLIERLGFSVERFRLENGRCPRCGRTIAGRWPEAEKLTKE